LEQEIILRNQQVAGSIPAGGSMFSISCGIKIVVQNG